MDLIQASILGLVQGLTEYLPVSSSAHLVLVPKWLGWHFDVKQAFVFDVLVQMGTLLGVIVYFFKDLSEIAKFMWQGLISGKPLARPESRLGWLVGLATIPSAVGGLLLKDEVASFFDSPKTVLAFLLMTAGLLVLAEFLSKGRRTEIKLLDAILIGLSQLLALLPGISRSGSTISVGVMMGLTKPAAARFSFLMSIPVMLGAGLMAARDIFNDFSVLQNMLAPLLVGILVSAVSGYLVIRWFLNFLKNQSLLWFAAYCALVGGFGLLLG
jgi:undecaprenyl-diphosphatase